MNSIQLFQRDDALQQVSLTADAENLKVAAIGRSALVQRVAHKDHLRLCVDAQIALANLLTYAKTSKEFVKRPVIDFGREIEEAYKSYIAEPREEHDRLCRLAGDFAALEDAKAKAREAAKRAELAQIERETLQQIAEAKSLEQVADIRERAAEAAAALPDYVPIRTTGQTIREEWEIESIDSFVLMRARPDLVRKIEFDRLSIKDELGRGITLPGVIATKVCLSGVRTVLR